YHDIHKPTVDCIPRVIKGLKKRGFTLVTVGELFQDVRLEPGEIYTKREGDAELLTASPPPPGSPAGPPEPSGRDTAPRARSAPTRPATPRAGARAGRCRGGGAAAAGAGRPWPRPSCSRESRRPRRCGGGR